MWLNVRKFALLALGVVALWLVSVLGLNLTVYSPGTYVLSYLNAVAEGNYGLAATKAGLSRVPAVLPVATQGISNPRIVGTRTLSSHQLVVQAQYDVAETSEVSFFIVEPGNPALWVFNTWNFVTSPTANLQFTAIGDNRVSVNGVELDTTQMGIPPTARVLVPGVYEASIGTDWVAAEAVISTVTEVDGSYRVRLRAEPTIHLLDTTTSAVEDYLDGCVAQGVLQPASCPFGVTINDRVIGVPEWKILDYPLVSLSLGPDRSTWSMVASGGVVESRVQVQSLFDGSVSEVVNTTDFGLRGTVRGTSLDEPVLNLY
jgi:hypothetical protein